MAQHTRTPWTAEHYLVVADRKTNRLRYAIADTYTPAAISDEEKENNAAFIVQACNVHDELLAACKAAEKMMRENQLTIGAGFAGVYDVVCAAITKASHSIYIITD